MPITRVHKKNVFPIIIIIILLFISTACQNMLIPSYGIIGEEFGIPAELFALPDALFVLISAGFALAWGYFADRIDRVKILLAGAFSWTFGMFFTNFSDSYLTLLISRAISGAGLGCVLPIGYSIITDAIPPDERSGWFGWIAIISSISNASGQALSSFLGPLTSWRFPFLLLSLISCVIIFMLLFAKMPKQGETEGELLELSEYNLEYSYKINKEDFIEITKKKTNRKLIIQGFFSIVPGTVLTFFLTTMLREYYFFELPVEIRLQTSTIFAGMVGIGYILGNLIFASLGDYLFKKNKKNRARLATFCMLASIPLALLMLLSLEQVEVDLLNLPTTIQTNEIGKYMIQAIVEIFTVYPSYIICFLFALLASILSAGPVANKNAVMVDVNMPEHKGTAASMFNFSEQIGKGITLIFSSWLILLVGSMYNMMFLSIFFWIPAGILWFMASRTVVAEMDKKATILSERRQITLIDYIFELEVQMDKAFQKIQDSKYYIEKNEKKFYILLDDALKIFKKCEHVGSSRSITNIQKKAHGMRIRVVNVKLKAKKIHKELKKEKLSPREVDDLKEELKNLSYEISIWGHSTFGELQMYYEDAYLKIVEAKLLKNRDLIKSITKINEAIIIYYRVRQILRERIDSVEVAEISGEEKKMYQKEHDLYNKSKKSLNATVILKEEIQKILNQLSEKGIQKEDLLKISDLTLEYQINLYKVMEDTFGKDEKTKKIIKEILNRVDEIFQRYESWKEDDFKVF